MMLKRIFLLLPLSLLLTTGGFAQGSPTPSGPATTATTTNSKKRPPVFRPTKDQIIQVQIKLKEKKLYSGEAIGKYNDETRAGIKSFQKENGLKQTGTLNRATLEKFEVELTDSQKLIPISQSSYATAESDKSSAKSSSKTVKPKTVIFRATADQIKSAQKMLKEKTMYNGEETGKLNNDTRAALKKYQDENGMKVTGTLNAVTLEKMGIPLTDKQKADAAATAKADN
jgi:peptidoglycan hydrolase-like protein with peptidoglycan-binding domain